MSDFETHVTLEGYSRIDFDKRPVRKGMTKIGQDLRKAARRLVARRAVSGAGQYPGKRTGELMKGIVYKVSKPGFMVKVRQDKTGGMEDFYPAFLYYGTPTIAARRNYIIDAKEARDAFIRETLTQTLYESLVPRE